MSDEPMDTLLIRALNAESGALGDPHRWLAPSEDLVTEARAGGDPETLVVALRAAAQAHRGLYHNDRALRLLTSAARVAERSSLEARLGEVLLARGVVRHELGQVAAARRDLDRAAALVGAETADEVADQRATLAANSGRLAEAAAHYRQVLAGRPGPLPMTRASNNLAIIEARRGRFAEAERWIATATAAATEVGPAYAAMVAETRAWIAVQAGQLAEGVALFARAEGLFATAGLPAGELYVEYADALLDLRLVPEAAAQARRAADLLHSQGVHLMAAEADLRVAALALLAGASSEAERLAEEAAVRLRRQRRPDWVSRARLVAVDARRAAATLHPADARIAGRSAQTLLGSGMPSLAVAGLLLAGRVAVALGRHRRALDCWDQAAALSRGAPVLVRLNGQLASALAAQARGHPAGVLRHARRGLDDLARHRSALASLELRALASGHGAELGSLGLSVLVRAGTPAQVFAWMERTRAAALMAVQPTPADGLDEETGALRALRAEIAEVRRESGVEPPELRAQQARVEARIRRTAWQASPGDGSAADAGMGAAAPRLTALRAALADRVLVEYDELDGRLLAVVVEPRRTRLVDLGPSAAVRPEVAGLRLTLRALASGASALRGAMLDVARTTVQRLTDLLVTPLALAAGQPLVVVPVGELQRVPWSALHGGPVCVAPSAALWLQTSALRPPADPRVLLAAGPGLAGAVDEVAALARIHRSAVVLVPPDSGAERVRCALDGACLVHLACHGSVRTDSPTFSSVLLADGPLTLHEVDLAEGAPYRVVLAACDVGDSPTYAGNEVLGFVGTLLARGTGGLLASTLPVPDTQVGELMLAVHEQLAAGLSLADALHTARSGGEPADPGSYVGWCTFTAYGAA